MADEPAELCLTGGFQDAVLRWCFECFGVTISYDQRERCDRFLEEALELVQTFPEFDRERAHKLVDYVYDRPVGERRQELGGVMVTLAALCNASSPQLIMGVAANRELARITDPAMMAKIRTKQASKKDIHGPLP